MATRVMRKHRLAECLLIDVIGLEWEDVHAEACRWEHVMSRPWSTGSSSSSTTRPSRPYGNPIPGLDELGDPDQGHDDEHLISLDVLAGRRRAACWCVASPNPCSPRRRS